MPVSTDDFNRTDNTNMGANWSNPGNPTWTTGGFRIVSNAATWETNNDGIEIWVGTAFGADQYAQAKCTVVGGTAGEGPGVCVRALGNTCYRACVSGSGFIQISKFVSGTYTNLGNIAVTWAAGDTLRLEVIGTTLRVYQNGVKQGSDVVDSSITTGSPGIAYSGGATSASVDDWIGGETVSFPATPVLDTFTGSDETPIATNWTAPIFAGDNSVRRISNAAVAAVAGGWSGAYYDLNTYGPDVEAYATITTLGASNLVWARVQDAGTGTPDAYLAKWLTGNAIQLQRVINGSATVIGSGTVVHSSGDGLGIRCVGSNIQLWTRQSGVWTLQLQVTDTNIVGAGRIGIEMNGTTPVMDDFGGGTIPILFPTTPVLDSFGGTLGSWTTPVFGDSALTISSGELASSVTGWSSGAWNTSFGQDQEVYFDIVTPTSARVSLIMRATDLTSSMDFYTVEWQATTGVYDITRYVNGAATLLKSGNRTLSSGDSIGATIIGATITLWRKPSGGGWGEVDSITDSSPVITSGQIGTSIFNNVSRTDNFGGGTYSPVTFPTTPVIDSFTGSDGSIDNRVATGGQTWDAPLFTGHTAASITSNAIVSPGSAGDYSAVISSTTYGPDCECYATFTSLPGGPARLYARISGNYGPTFPDTYGDGNYYVLVLTAGTSYVLSRHVAGTDTTVINGTSWSDGNLSAGDKVGFSCVEEATGTRIRVFRMISGIWLEDANYLDTATRPSGAGYLGFELDVTTTMDDFGGGTLVSLSNSFESALADETAITEANSDDDRAGDAFDAIDDDGAIKFDTLRSAHGTYSAKITNTTVRNGVRWGETSLGSQIQLFGRVYVYRTAHPSTEQHWIMRAEGTSDNGLNAIITWQTSGELLVYDNDFSWDAAGITLPLNQWVRFEWRLVCDEGGNGSIECRAYAGDSLGLLGTAIVTGGDTGASCEAISYGDTNDTPNSGDIFWIDDVQVNVTEFPGVADGYAAEVLADNPAAYYRMNEAAPFSTAILDDFNRADENPLSGGGNWQTPWLTGGKVARIVSNQVVRETTTGLEWTAIWDAATFGPDCECHAVVNSVPDTGTNFAIFVRATSLDYAASTGYYLSILPQTSPTADQWKLFRQIPSGSDTQLGATVGQDLASGDSIGIRCIGTTIEAWHKPSAGSWTLILSRTDANVTGAGYVAFESSNGSNHAFDNFGGGNVTTHLPQDSSGNARHITGVSGTPTYAQAGAIATDPISKGIRLELGETFYLDNAVTTVTDNWTIETWAKLGGGSISNGRTVIRNATTAGWELGCNIDGTFYYENIGAGVGSNSIGALNTSEWKLIHVIRRAGITEYWINGVADTIGAGGSAPGTPSGTVQIGAAVGLDILLDEVAIYPTALSPARVLAHYEAAIAEVIEKQTFYVYRRRSYR